MIRLSLTRAALARMHEGQLINAAWTLWLFEEEANAAILHAREDLFLYGSCALLFRPGRIEVIKPTDIPYGIPPGGLR